VEGSTVTSIPNELFAIEGLGCTITGTTTGNCADFSSTSGDALTATEVYPCAGSALSEILCLCLDYDFSAPPTIPNAPTKSPTAAE